MDNISDVSNKRKADIYNRQRVLPNLSELDDLAENGQTYCRNNSGKPETRTCFAWEICLWFTKSWSQSLGTCWVVVAAVICMSTWHKGRPIACNFHNPWCHGHWDGRKCMKWCQEYGSDELLSHLMKVLLSQVGSLAADPPLGTDLYWFLKCRKLCSFLGSAGIIFRSGTLLRSSKSWGYVHPFIHSVSVHGAPALCQSLLGTGNAGGTKQTKILLLTFRPGHESIRWSELSS